MDFTRQDLSADLVLVDLELYGPLADLLPVPVLNKAVAGLKPMQHSGWQLSRNRNSPGQSVKEQKEEHTRRKRETARGHSR